MHMPHSNYERGLTDVANKIKQPTDKEKNLTKRISEKSRVMFFLPLPQIHGGIVAYFAESNGHSTAPPPHALLFPPSVPLIL